MNWTVKNPRPGFCPRQVSDGAYRAPYFHQCTRRLERAVQSGALGSTCRFHRLVDERRGEKDKAWSARESEQEKIQREGKALAAKLKARYGLNASVHYSARPSFKDSGYTRDLVISFDQLRALVESP